jgi:hypothetical protein
MVEQKRNDDLVELLRPDFFARYEPNASLVHAGLHLQLRALRGYWPMSSVDENGDIYDLSGQGRVLTNHDSVPLGQYNLFTYASFSAPDYLSRVDEAGLDITGNLSVGGWFWLDTLASGSDQVLMSKYDTSGGANQRSYLLWFDDATNTFRFGVSSAGTAATFVQIAHTAVISANAWYHVAGRFTPNTDLSVYVDGVRVSTAAGVPAGAFNSTADFEIGSDDNGTAAFLDGRACQCWLCAHDLYDVMIPTLYHQTRANFGK